MLHKLFFSITIFQNSIERLNNFFFYICLQFLEFDLQMKVLPWNFLNLNTLIFFYLKKNMLVEK